MKFKLLTVSMPLLLMLTACNQSNKYEGYTPVESDTKSEKLYINTSTVRRSPNGVVNFSMIIDSAENHIIHTAKSDCIHKLTMLDDNEYSQKNKLKQEKLTLSNKNNAEITKLVCDKLEENRTIKGDFNDSKALEIEYGNYDVNTKNVTWKNIEPPHSLNGYERFKGKDGLVKILESKDFKQDENVKHVLLTATSLIESSDVLLGATVFVKKDNNWLIDREYFYLTTIDGVIKSARWQNIGKRNYSIVVEKESNDTSDNNAFLFDVNKSSTLVEFDSTNGIDLTFDDTEQDYPNLTVTNKSGETNNKDIYHYTNEKYELLGTESLKLLRAQFLEELRKNNRTKIWFEQAFKIGSDNFFVTFTKTSTSEYGDFNDCHACAPNIGSVTYKNINNEWKLISKQTNFGKFGEYGDAPTPEKKIEKFPLKNEKIIFLLNSIEGGMGLTNIEKSVLMFINNNWYFKGYITISENFITGIDECDKEPVNQCWSYDGKASIIEDKKEIPSFLVTKNGTYYDFQKSRITRAKNSIYTYNGEEYVEKEELITQSKNIEKENKSLKSIINDGSPASALVIDMINYAIKNGNGDNDSKIQEAKNKIEKFSKITVKNKKEARALNDKGLALSKIGNLEAAIKTFEDAHKLNPADIEILNNLGFSQMKFGNFDEAQKSVITVLTMSPSRSVAWNTLGDIFAHKGELERAVACLTNSIKFSKDKSKTIQILKKWNENEDDINLNQVRFEAINLEENKIVALNKNVNINSETTNEDIGELCEASALVDAQAVDFDDNGSLIKLNTNSSLKKGDILRGVTQYLLNSETHESILCQNYGYCYVANKNLNGDITQTIQFSNCNVGIKYPHQEGEAKNVNSYQLKLDRSKFSTEFLAEYDMKNKLNEIGIIPYITDNAVKFSINNPNSTCASYVNKSLEGDADAIKNLNSNGSQYCSDSYVEEKYISAKLQKRGMDKITANESTEYYIKHPNSECAIYINKELDGSADSENIQDINAKCDDSKNRKIMFTQSWTVDRMNYAYCWGYLIMEVGNIHNNINNFSGGEKALLNQMEISLFGIANKMASYSGNAINDKKWKDDSTKGTLDAVKEFNSDGSTFVTAEANDVLTLPLLKVKKCSDFVKVVEGR